MRTEQEILKDFEALGWKVSANTDEDLLFKDKCDYSIHIWKKEKTFMIELFVQLEIHKLLNELFSVWGWL